jgi:hypothetical protein
MIKALNTSCKKDMEKEPKETKTEKKKRILWDMYIRLLNASKGCG